MKKTNCILSIFQQSIYISFFIFLIFNLNGPKTSIGQEFADYTLIGVHQGTGTFNNAVLPDFYWVVDGTLSSEVQIPDDEVFDDGNVFEDTFGQADFAENLRIQIVPNGVGTSGQPLTSHATLTLDFDEVTPGFGWGFCLVDIDVENALVSAINQNDEPVPNDEIDSWMMELFDANLAEDGINLPKWDPLNAAVLGSDTPESYLVYNNLVIGGMPSCEAPAVCFMPDIPIKSLVIEFENLQENYNTSYHFYIASVNITGINDQNKNGLQLWPNPASRWFKVSQGMPMTQIGEATLEIIDLVGKKLVEKQIPAGSNDFEVDVRSLENGVYWCRLSKDNNSITKKLIIKK